MQCARLSEESAKERNDEGGSSPWRRGVHDGERGRRLQTGDAACSSGARTNEASGVPLAGFGERDSRTPRSTCGAEWFLWFLFETLFAAAKRAKGALTSGGIEFHLILRPLLLDEHA